MNQPTKATTKGNTSSAIASSDRLPATSRTLSLRIGAALCLLGFLFAALADYFLYQSLVNKDHSLLSARLQNYLRIQSHAGTDKLIEVIGQEGTSSERWLIEIRTDDEKNFSNQLVLSGVAHSTDKTTDTLRLTDPYWPVLNTQKKRWLLAEAVTEDQTRITLGLSSLERQQQQVAYRWAILATLLPLIAICLWLVHRTHQNALRPLRDFLHTSQSMQAQKDLSQRFDLPADDSELRQLALQTNRFLSTIERLFNGMQASLDHVAHDLRTPIARQRLRVEQLMLQPQVLNNPELTDALGEIAEENERISRMLTTLMDISQAESGTLPLHIQSLDLAQLLQQVVEVYSFVAEDKACTLILDCPTPFPVQADEVRLRQMVMNLIDNALKFSPDGSTVTVKAHVDADNFVLEVQDQGCGIPSEEQALVFDRLYRGDKSRSTQGMGLGLSLVKAIAEAHHGRIALSSSDTPPSGCCFTLTLPLQPPEGPRAHL